VEFNHLQSLPIELTQLDKLHWLFLHNNKLKKIPEALRNISFLTNLVALSLGNNDFEPNQQRNIATSGALNYCIKRAQDTLRAKEALSQMRQERFVHISLSLFLSFVLTFLSLSLFLVFMFIFVDFLKFLFLFRNMTTQTKLSLSKQNFLQRASSSSRLPRFSRCSMGSSAVIEDPIALVKAFENLLVSFCRSSSHKFPIFK
jgi:Leucine-rich repeat (LRR) protein